VIDFITQRLYQLGIVPELLPHVCGNYRTSSIYGHHSSESSCQRASFEIVAQLHPTPAVAGAARDIACAEIRYESFELAAPLGWVDYQGNSEFIVGIARL